MSTTSEAITPEDKVIHPKVVFQSNEQGVVAMMRTIVSFGVRKRKEWMRLGKFKISFFEHVRHRG